MSEAIKASNVNVRQKMSPAQEDAQFAKDELASESKTPAEEMNTLPEPELITPAEMPKVTLTADQLATLMVNASQGRRSQIQIAEPSNSTTERILDNTLGAVGDGLHRIADGARDIIGGAIDIITLGRAGRR